MFPNYQLVDVFAGKEDKEGCFSFAKPSFKKTVVSRYNFFTMWRFKFFCSQ